MKKSLLGKLSAVLAAVITVTSIPVTASAEGEVSALNIFESRKNGDVEYNVIGDYSFSYCDGKAEIIYYGGSETNLVIPETLDGYVVTSIGANAFNYRTSIKTLTIGDNVTSIGEGAFAYCTSLESVSLGSKLSSIGKEAFSYCSMLTTVNIPEGVTSLGKSAFYGCSALKTVTIPKTVTSIGGSAFGYCTALSSITVASDNNNFKSENNIVFSKDGKTLCVYPAGLSATSYTVPSGVTAIGDSAFSYCTKLQTITVPDSVTSIGAEAFSNCTGISSMNISKNVTYIGGGAFRECVLLASLTVDSDNANYKSVDNAILSKDGKTFHTYYKRLTPSTYKIPSGVTKIEDYAFASCVNLTSISIPSTVTEIGDGAFFNNIALTSISIPDGVTRIGEYAFMSCKKLTSAKLGKNVTSLGIYAFMNCISLSSVIIQNKVTLIDSGAFYKCSALSNVYYTGSEGEWGNVTINANNEPLTAAKFTYNYVIPEAKPEIISVTPGNKEVKVEWSLVDDAEKYCVYYYLNDSYQSVAETTESSYTVTGLANGTKYGFLVRAYVNGAWTSYSIDDVVYSTPVAPAVENPVPTATAGNAQVALKWNAISGATVYRVFYYLNGEYKNVADTTSTSYTVTGLTNGTNYGFLVRAFVNGEWTTYSNSDLVYATPVAPAVEKPVISSATAGNGQVTLKWGAVNGATKYAVCYYQNGKYTTAGETTSTSYTVTGLTNGTNYGFFVKAYANGVWSEYTSADFVYATPAAPVVAKPVISSATAGNGQVALKWGAVSGASKYRVYYYLNGEYTSVTDVTTTSYTVTGLTNGTKYGFLVIAYADGVWSTYTTANLVYATPVAPEVVKPVISSATAGNGQVALKWGAVSGASKYRVYYYLNGEYTSVTDVTTTSYTVTGLTNGTKYGFLVIAYADGVWSTYTTADLVYATPVAPEVGKPVISSATAGNGQVALKWGAVSGASKYRVYYYLNGEYTSVTDVTTTSYTVTGLTNGTKYGFLVIAYADGVWSTYTTADLVYATPVAPEVAKPVISSAVAGNGQVALKWGAVSGATKYSVYYYLNGKYTTVAETTATSYTVTGLTNGTKYGFLVKAYANGVWSTYTTADLVYATPVAPSVGKPVISSATAGNGQVALKWGAVSGATKYSVYYYLNGKYTTVAETTATSYTVTGLTNGTKYGFLVKAYANGVWSTYTTADLVYATPVAPSVGKPVISSATAGNGQVALKWGAVSGAEKYRVFYYLNGNYATVIDTTATSYTVTGLKNGTKYGFLVRAYANGVWSAYTTADNIYATPVAPAVAKPVVTAYAGNSKARLNWTKVSGASKYAIYIYSGGKYTLYKNTTLNYYNVSGLTNGTKYGFLVRAYVNGTWSPYTTADIAYATPVAKPVVTAYAGNGRVRLNWTKVSGASKYAIYTYSGGKYSLYKATTANAYNVTGLTNGTKYTFLVRAYVNGKWTAYNIYDQVSATPIDKPVISKTVAADGKVRLYWNKVAGATKYAVYIYSDGKYTLYKNTTATAYTVSGLKNGTSYGFLVRAYVNGKWTAYNVYDRVSATPKA